MTIYEIKRLTAKTAPYHFTPKSLRFFGQTMKSYSVRKQPDGRYKISADIKGDMVSPGRVIGKTVRYFNPQNNELEME